MAYGSVLTDVVQSSTAGTPPQFNDGNGTQIGTLCRAWVNYKGTATVSIRGSFNVSSVTVVGTGQYTVNFTTALPDTNYAPVGSSDPDNLTPWIFTANTLNTTSCRVFLTRPAVAYSDGNVYAAFFR